MPQYPTTRLDRAIDAALARDAKVEREPLVLCTHPGPAGEQCALQDGHRERVGNQCHALTGKEW